jgi:acyl transferase domain-containing protein
MLVALGRASLAPVDIGSAEAHGTGTALGDPTEAGALVEVHGVAERPTPCVVGAAKASFGHSEAASGQVGLLRLRRVLKSSAASGNAQLRVLNPLVSERLGGRSARFTLPAQGMRSRLACGVSAFGVSGTIAHAALSLAQSAEASNATPIGAMCREQWPVAFRRRFFPCRVPLHPFVQRRMPASGGTDVFRSPATGALHAVVADHMVQDRVIFPGAGYLEMARAAAAAGTTLRSVFFLQPLALEVPGLHVECALGNGRFEVRGGERVDDVTVHCSGAFDSSSHDASGPSTQAHVRGQRCVQAVDVVMLYDHFHAGGLQYGPEFRTLVQAWESAGAAAARLRARLAWHGTHVHPADLDDALCVGAITAKNYSDGRTRVPFAVDDAHLQSVRGELWAVR